MNIWICQRISTPFNEFIECSIYVIDMIQISIIHEWNLPWPWRCAFQPMSVFLFGNFFIISLHLQQQKYLVLDDHDHNSHSAHVWSWYMLCGCSLMVLKIFSSNRLKKKMNNKFEFQNNTNHIIILGLISILDSSCWVFAK